MTTTLQSFYANRQFKHQSPLDHNPTITVPIAASRVLSSMPPDVVKKQQPARSGIRKPSKDDEDELEEESVVHSGEGSRLSDFDNDEYLGIDEDVELPNVSATPSPP